ncbi:MAG: vWA domain-containing protein, partial [Myxococcota bacterium]
RPSRRAAIRAACDHQQVASMYVIGFSSSTNTEFNNLLAAAGGTGSCVDRNGGPIDPCSANMSQLIEDRDQADIKVSCTGSFQADTGDEYRQALEQITSDIACTYPLDILNTPDGKAPSDPAGTRVYLDQCPAGSGTHTAYGSEFDSARSDASSVSRAPLGLPCTDECGVTYSQGERITYDMPTTPGQTNTVRLRVADYLHDCQDPLSVAVHADNQPIGTWTGNGINDFQVLEFDFTPSADRTFITIYQTNDAYCGGSNNCTGTCGEFADDLNMVVDWVKMEDPEAGCASGGLSYVPSGQSGNGWTFAEDRTKVKLVGQACASVKARQHDAVTTQVACPCEQTPGGTCLAPEGAECPTGKWQCTADWNDVCVPDTGCDPDKFCAEKTQHDVQFGQPNIQMVVDRSGSMSSKVGGKSLWELARRVLADLAAWSYIGDGCGTGANAQNCDRLHLGLDFWSSGSISKIAAGEDTRPQQIRDAFDDEAPPSGGTQFHRAAELLRDEDNLQETSAPNFGLMVTDGYPDHQWTLRESAEILCNIRRRVNAPITTYVVGFGGNTDQQINSFVAAAGGTGSCCYGNNCDPYEPAEAVDPCGMLDYEVVNRDAMINQFESELTAAQRSQWQSLYNYLSSSKGRTRETVNHKIDLAYDLMRYWGLSNFSQSLRDRFKETMAYGTQHRYSRSSTWHGGSGDLPEQVSDFSHLYADRDDTARLTNGLYCEGGVEAKNAAELKRRIIEIFESVECAFPLTLLPDMTSAPENPEATTVGIYLSNAQSMVDVPHVDNSAGQQQLVDELRAKGVNNAGRFGDDGWQFGNQSRTYVELTDDLCSEVQSRNISRVDTQVCKLCEKTGQPCDVPCEQGDSNCGPDGYLMGRCKVGVYQCVQGEDTCVQTRNPMPEICNGIDDDCDGKRGDLRENEVQWSQPQWNLQSRYDGDYSGLSCFNRDVCACENGEPDDIHGSAADADEFQEHLRGQDADQKDGTANCYCGEGLESDATPAASMSHSSATDDQPAPDPVSDDGAACTTSVTGAPGDWAPAWLLGVLLVIGLARRRRSGRVYEKFA